MNVLVPKAGFTFKLMNLVSLSKGKCYITNIKADGKIQKSPMQAFPESQDNVLTSLVFYCVFLLYP